MGVNREARPSNLQVFRWSVMRSVRALTAVLLLVFLGCVVVTISFMLSLIPLLVIGAASASIGLPDAVSNTVGVTVWALAFFGLLFVVWRKIAREALGDPIGLFWDRLRAQYEREHSD